MKRSGVCFVKLTAAISVFAMMLSLCSCGASRKKKALEELSDNLCGSYTSEVSFRVPATNIAYEGKAQIAKKDTVTQLDISSPEPYAGISIEYDVKGLPSSVAIRFSGMETTLPRKAVSKINAVAVLFADDFASTLQSISTESITEYELADGKKGCCASLVYGDAQIALYFSAENGIPYSMEYRSDLINADIIFDSFHPTTDKAEE